MEIYKTPERFFTVDRKTCVVIKSCSNGFVVDIGYSTRIAKTYKEVLSLLNEVFEEEECFDEDLSDEDKKHI